MIGNNKTNVAPSIGCLYQDACLIIDQAQQTAYRAVNETLIKRNWLLGMRIQHEVLKEQRAEYGEQVIKLLSEELVKRYGRGFSMRNLYYFVNFYHDHVDFFQLSIEKSKAENIVQSSIAKSDFASSFLNQKKMNIVDLQIY